MSLKEKLGEELYKQMMEKLGDDKVAIISDGSYIPKEKFDAVNNEKKQLGDQLKERDTQLEELGKKAKGNEELTTQIQQLTDQNKATKTEYEEKLKQQSFDFALKDALTAAKVKNPKALKALLDTDTIKLDGDKLLGLEEQLKAIKESDGYLFDSEDAGGTTKPTFTAGQHQSHQGGSEPASLTDALAQRFTK